jgi:hypothetical protein
MHPSAAASATEARWAVTGRRVHDPRFSGSAAIDLDAPAAGIVLGNSLDPAADHLLGLDLQNHWRLSDHWARGSDVTAVYESDDARHLRATAMWRLHPCGTGVSGWQVVVSAQTSLLHSDSILAVRSAVASPTADMMWGTSADGTVRWRPTPSAAATCLLLRRSGGDRGSVLMAGHPGEVGGIEVQPQAGRTAIACWLFSTALEKGVLLRSRVLAAVGPADGDEAWATATAAEFAALPPMLTT